MVLEITTTRGRDIKLNIIDADTMTVDIPTLSIVGQPVRLGLDRLSGRMADKDQIITMAIAESDTDRILDAIKALDQPCVMCDGKGTRTINADGHKVEVECRECANEAGSELPPVQGAGYCHDCGSHCYGDCAA